MNPPNKKMIKLANKIIALAYYETNSDMADFDLVDQEKERVYDECIKLFT